MKKNIKQLLLTTVLLVAVLSSYSYPITPQPLRKLIKNSKYIVIAKVDNPVKPQKPTKYFDKTTGDTVEIKRIPTDIDGKANLQIIEVLKGEISSSKITVNYQPGLICPAPPRYPDKKTVIAFLVKANSADTFHTYALSYGSKIMENDKELTAYKKRITEFMQIQKTIFKRKRKKKIVEWLVKCAENKYTRWEGAYELDRRKAFMSNYDQSKDEKFAKYLTDEQKQRLSNAFFSIDSINTTDLLLTNFIDKEDYSKMNRKLLKNLSFADYYLAEKLMEVYVEFTPKDELKTILNELNNIEYDDKEKESKTKKLTQKFIELARKE